MTISPLLEDDRVARRKARDKAYGEANAARIAAYRAEYRAKNRDALLQKKREAHARNRESDNAKAAANFRRYYADNKDWILAKKRMEYASDPKKYIQRVAQWRASNPDKASQIWGAYNVKAAFVRRRNEANRRARKLLADGVLSVGLAEKLIKLQKDKCACCGTSLRNGYHMDHITPLALGGLNIDSNMQLLSPKCNMRKGKRDPVTYMRSKGFLL